MKGVVDLPADLDFEVGNRVLIKAKMKICRLRVICVRVAVVWIRMKAVEVSGQILKILWIKTVVYADGLDVGYEKVESRMVTRFLTWRMLRMKQPYLILRWGGLRGAGLRGKPRI